MAVETRAQASFGEEVIEDADLEALLEQRQRLKENASEARQEYDAKNEEAKGVVQGMKILEDEIKRCGRFLLSTTNVKAGHREFDTKAKTNVSIRLAKE